MTKKILLLLLTLNLTYCKSQIDVNYSDKFKNCLSNTDIELLNKATHNFENLLTNYYENDDTNENFKKYLTDISSIKSVTHFNAEFFLNLNTRQIVSEMEEYGTFGKIWVKYKEDEKELEEEIPMTLPPGYNEPEEESIEIYVLNTNGKFLECLSKIYTNKKLIEILNLHSKYGDVSPSIPASEINKIMTKSDFDNEINKVIVTIGFYYNIVNLLNSNPK